MSPERPLCKNAFCFELSSCVVHGSPLPLDFGAAVAAILPGVDYLSVALVASCLDHLLHFPIVHAGQAVTGPVAATAKCKAGTAAWQAFSTRSHVYGGSSPGGVQAFADWTCLPSEVATVITVPLDTAQGLVGTGTFASSKGELLDPTSITWLAGLLGQCLAHCRCHADLQIAVSQNAPGQSVEAADCAPPANLQCIRKCSAGQAAQPPGPVSPAGSRTFAYACQRCFAVNVISISPADLGLQSMTSPAPLLDGAQGPPATPSSTGGQQGSPCLAAGPQPHEPASAQESPCGPMQAQRAAGSAGLGPGGRSRSWLRTRAPWGLLAAAASAAVAATGAHLPQGLGGGAWGSSLPGPAPRLVMPGLAVALLLAAAGLRRWQAVVRLRALCIGLAAWAAASALTRGTTQAWSVALAVGVSLLLLQLLPSAQ